MYTLTSLLHKHGDDIHLMSAVDSHREHTAGLWNQLSARPKHYIPLPDVGSLDQYIFFMNENGYGGSVVARAFMLGSLMLCGTFAVFLEGAEVSELRIVVRHVSEVDRLLVLEFRSYTKPLVLKRKFQERLRQRTVCQREVAYI